MYEECLRDIFLRDVSSAPKALLVPFGKFVGKTYATGACSTESGACSRFRIRRVRTATVPVNSLLRETSFEPACAVGSVARPAEV